MLSGTLAINTGRRAIKRRAGLRIDQNTVLPVLSVRGCQPGPTLVVSANVHGDEYEGVRAIFETFEELDPDGMSGDLLAAPVVNPPAFWSGTRTSPVDGENLARIFPGQKDGNLSQKIAYYFGRAIIARADFYLDLHSGGVKYRMPSMAGYSSADARGRAAAEAFGAPVIWGHPPPIEAGRTISFAEEHAIPWLYTEARGAGRIHPQDLRMMKSGILNLLRHLSILPGKSEPARKIIRLYGNGNTDSGLVATQSGFFMSQVAPLDLVIPGQLLGRLVNLRGEPLEEYRSPSTGVIGMTREFPVVQVGDPLFLIAQNEE